MYKKKKEKLERWRKKSDQLGTWGPEKQHGMSWPGFHFASCVQTGYWRSKQPRNTNGHRQNEPQEKSALSVPMDQKRCSLAKQEIFRQ